MNMRKNTIMMAIYEVLIYIAPLITAPYIARILGTKGTGIYSFTYSIAGYFVIAIQLGVSMYGRREIAGKLDVNERTETFWGIFSVLGITFIVSSFVYVFVIIICRSEFKVYFLWQYLVLVAGWLDIGWFFFGIEEFKLAVSRNVVVKLLSLVLVFTLIKNSTDTLKYVILMATTNLISVVVMWIALPKYITRTKFSINKAFSHFKPLLILAVPVLSIQLYSITDKVFIGMMMDMDSVGIYENMYKLSRVPVALITTVGTVLLPRITNMIAAGREQETYSYIEKSLSITIILGSACSFGLIGIAPWLVEMYYGKDFVSGIPILQILSIVLLILAWGNVFRTQYIIPRKLDRIYLVSVVSAAIINIILNTVMIPIFGAIGAAIASIISELMVCIYQSYKIRENFNYTSMLKKNSIYFISGLLMASIVYIAGLMINRSTVLSVVILFFIGGVSYLITCLVLETVTKTRIMKDEINRLIRTIKR